MEVIHVFPTGRTVGDFVAWLRRHGLGRKRLLDTMLAATMRNTGVARMIRNNARDFEELGCFEIVGFR